MNVRDVMTSEPDVVVIDTGTTVGRAAEALIRHGIGALPVTDNARIPVGLVAEREIALAVQESPQDVAGLSVQRVMRRPPPLCSVDDDIQSVMSRMTRERLRHLIVCEGGRLAGVLSVGDLLKHRLRELELETGVLRDYVAAQRSRA